MIPSRLVGTVFFILNLNFFLQKSMSKTIAEKLRIREGMKIAPLHAPEKFISNLAPLPGKINVLNSLKNSPDQIHWFVRNKAEMEKEVKEVLQSLQPGILLWIYYPKGTSKIQTDLTRDKGWEGLMKMNTLQWISLISFDDTWSAFACRLIGKDDAGQDRTHKEDPADKYLDAEKKIVRTPDDFENELRRNPDQKKFYDALSYSNKKEYVTWIVSARKEETRKARIQGAVERLVKGWKNPANN